MHNPKIRILSGTSHPELAKKIAEELGASYTGGIAKHFSDGEIQVDIGESVRGYDVFVVQPIASSEQHSVNDNIMELLIIIDALKRASAESISLVIPYFGYARQDRKVGTWTPITAKLLSDVIQVAGAQRVITLDLHSDQIQGFFNIPVDNLNATGIISTYIASKQIEDLVVVSPDAGGTKRARKMAKLLGDAPLVLIDKRRPAPNVSEVMNILGDIEGKNALIVDDMIDTAGTICNAVEALKAKGAKDVYIAATHGVLSGQAVTRLNDVGAKEVIVCDTMYRTADKEAINNLVVLSPASLLGAAIEKIHKKESITDLIS
jgi:ribose-phosphate pyrophosphokinase